MEKSVLIVINGYKLPVREYKNMRVITFKDIDTVHNRPSGTARKRFNDNKKHFIEGEDYYKVKCSEVRPFFGQTLPNGYNPTADIILITESGYLMLVKSFTDDLAWTVQRQLVNSYFKSLDTSIVTITPAIAEEMLKHNQGNRRINKANVRRIADDMLTGNYKLNGETLKFYDDGSLADGQHRLNACILANVPFQTYVIKGVKREVLPTIDCGKSRNMVDGLNMIGCGIQPKLVPAMNYYFNHSNKLTASQAECLWNTYEKQFEFLCKALKGCHHNYVLSQRDLRAFLIHLILVEKWNENDIETFIDGLKRKPTRETAYEMTAYYFLSFYDKKIHGKLHDTKSCGEKSKGLVTIDALCSVAESFTTNKVIKSFVWKNRSKAILDAGYNMAQKRFSQLKVDVQNKLIMEE